MRTRLTAASLAILVAGTIAGCSQEPGTGPPADPGTTSAEPHPDSTGPTVSATPTTGTPTTGTPRALPIYYIVDTPAGFRLYREFHQVPVAADAGTDAVRELLRTPGGIDPDYMSSWPAGTTLASDVTHESGVITVDLSQQAATASVGSEAAEMTIQQLVFTVQGALQATDPVQILIEGQPVDELWGHVVTNEPIERADPTAVRSLVQINSPAHGATVGGEVVVTGEAAAFEANVPWEILQNGAVVQEGFATAAEGQRFSAFTFTVTLAPGTYTIRIIEDDPSGGAGRPPFEDTKDITVTA